MVKGPLRQVVSGAIAGPFGKEYLNFPGSGHVTIPPWTPPCARWEIVACFTPTDLSGTAFRTIFAGGPNSPIEARGPTMRIDGSSDKLQIGYGNGTTYNPLNSAAALTEGKLIIARWAHAPDTDTLYINGVKDGSSPVDLPGTPATGVDVLGANEQTVPGAFMQGSLAYLGLTIPSPLQGRRAMGGSAVSDREALIPQRTFTGDFLVRGWFVHTNTPEGVRLASDDLGANTFAATYAGTNRLEFGINGTVHSSPVDSLVAGQHYQYELGRVGGNATLKLNGVEQLAGSPTDANPATYTVIYGQGTTNTGAGGVASVEFVDLETGQVWNYANRNDSGNVLENINPATAEGPELYDFTNVGTSGAGIIEQTRTGYYFDGSNDIPQASERSYINLPATEAGKHYQITGRLRVASPIAGSDLTIFARDGQNGDGTILASVGVDVNTREEFRLVFAASGVASTLLFDGQGGVEQYWVDNISIKEVTHGIWYESGVAMTDAAADAARTRLPMINRHYVTDIKGRVVEVQGGGADGTLVGLTAADWAAP